LVAFLSKAAYSDHLQARWLTPALRDGADLESSVTGAIFGSFCAKISDHRTKEEVRTEGPKDQHDSTQKPNRLPSTAFARKTMHIAAADSNS
jgi:hypothetical protein